MPGRITLTLVNPVAAVTDPAIDLLSEALAYSVIEAFQAGWDGLIPAEGDHRAAVHEAVGMISVRHQCALDNALALIRARAFAGDCDVYALADSILHGTANLS